MNDQDFDALFRKAAEHHRVPYKPGAWEKMRAKLNRGEGKSGASVRGIAGLGLLLLLGVSVGMGVWYQTWPSEPKTTETAITEQASNPKETNPVSTPDKLAEPTLSDELKKEKSIKIMTQELSSSTTNDEQPSSSTFFFQATQESSSALMHPGKVGYLTRNPVRDKALSVTFPSVLPFALDPRKSSVLPDLKQGTKPVGRWRISLGGSPDISAINLGEAGQVGSKIAVGLEYFIIPRLSIQTGVIFSNKLYEATGESYKPYPGYWKKYPVPNSIDARCDVLDIPINLRYYAISFPRSRVFVSGGVSSYLMLTEDYVYNYLGGYGQKPGTYKYSERNENRHYFKVANVSLGYERLLSKRWALQVEPFVKMPVAGVGFGNIKLSTTGVFVSLNYRLR